MMAFGLQKHQSYPFSYFETSKYVTQYLNCCLIGFKSANGVAV